MIYNSLDDDIATFLHKKGFKNEKRSFKMFAFSRLMGSYDIDSKRERIEFKDSVSLVVSSPFKEFCNSLATGMFTQDSIRIGSTNMEVTQSIMENEVVTSTEIRIQTLSPIVLYSTFLRPDGRKYTCYFQPEESEYDDLLSNNLKNKYRAFYREEPPTGEVELRSLNQPRLSVMKYKNIVIKGYSGRFILRGPVPLLQMAIDGGLGSKNSQGFGCIKLIK